MKLVRTGGNGTGARAETFIYQLDAAARLQQLTRTAGTTVTTLNYQYDSLNRVTSRQVNGEPTSYTYDKVGRILTLTHKAQTTSYTWDAASRLTQKTLPNNIKQQMVYDNAGRLTSLIYKAANNTLLEQLDYAYDARGQRISKTTQGAYPIAREAQIQATYNAANRLTSLTLVGAGAPATVGGAATNETYSMTYDDNGNLTEKRQVAQAGQPPLAQPNITTFSWDKQNQLTAMTQVSANVATNITASFSYDQFGRRTNKTINGEAVNYVYDGDQAVGESSSTASTSQLTGMGIDEHIARYTGQDQLVYLTDALGSIIAQTKADGSFQNKYGYSPYGQVAKDADDKGNPHQYTGRENDNTGLMFYRARYYMPKCGRFISEDPIGTAGGMNLYGYVGGDPVNATDPSGLLQCDIDAALDIAKFAFPQTQQPLDREYFSTSTSKGAASNKGGGGGGGSPARPSTKFGHYRPSFAQRLIGVGPWTLGLNDKFLAPLDGKFSPRELLDTVLHEFGHAAKWREHTTPKLTAEYDKKVADLVDLYEREFNDRRAALCGN